MSEGMTKLEENIVRFESLIAEMKTVTSEAHMVLRDMRLERKEIEKLLGPTTQKLVGNAIEQIVIPEIKAFSDALSKQSHQLYDKIGDQVDKLINLSLGKEFSTKQNTMDLRPALAAKLREWIREVLEDETLTYIEKKGL